MALLVGIAPGTAAAAVGRPQGSATSDSDIVSLRAYIVSYTTGQDVAVIDDFVLRSGTRRDGVWATAGPIRLTELTGYRVDVEATDADGDSVTATGAGDLNYRIAALRPADDRPDDRGSPRTAS